MIRYAAFNEVRLNLENGQVFVDPTPEQISALLKTLDGDGNSFAILAADGMTYLQVSGGPVSGFQVEYQAGSLLKHFGSNQNDLPISKVDAIFRAYALRDPSWKGMTEWSRQDLTSSKALSPTSVVVLLAIGALIFAALRWWKNAA